MPLSPTDKVAAVIVTHRRVELLQHSLRVVAAQTQPVKWIIVVDNGCEEAVEQLVREVAGERGVYLPSRHNLGGAGGFAYGFLTALALGANACGAPTTMAAPKAKKCWPRCKNAPSGTDWKRFRRWCATWKTRSAWRFRCAAAWNGGGGARSWSIPPTPGTTSYPESLLCSMAR